MKIFNHVFWGLKPMDGDTSACVAKTSVLPWDPTASTAAASAPRLCVFLHLVQ